MERAVYWKRKRAKIIPEAVATYELRIWHAIFGMPGSHNDINVFDRSSRFSDLVNGRTPEVNFTVNGNNYTKGYYLVDGMFLSLFSYF
jgi:hypothetical protein